MYFDLFLGQKGGLPYGYMDEAVYGKVLPGKRQVILPPLRSPVPTISFLIHERMNTYGGYFCPPYVPIVA